MNLRLVKIADGDRWRQTDKRICPVADNDSAVVANAVAAIEMRSMDAVE